METNEEESNNIYLGEARKGRHASHAVQSRRHSMHPQDQLQQWLPLPTTLCAGKKRQQKAVKRGLSAPSKKKQLSLLHLSPQ